MDLLIYLPAGRKGPAPLFVGLNSYGNHTIHPDKGILLAESWLRNRPEYGITENRATEQSRGASHGRWSLEKLLDRGYGLATFYYGDIEPDDPARFDSSVRKMLLAPGREKLADDEWGAIGAWAWGLSCAMDHLQTDADIDSARVAVMGHSRLGKAALWAGATDERFAVVISNNSGCGGAALSRRKIGETVRRINTSFPHWFCGNFKRYNDREDDCPVDQHLLLALSAPRPVYVASAQLDQWADPKGEFLSAVGADAVYRMLTGEGLPAKRMPPVNRPAHGRIGYHIRTGGHGVQPFDWQCYMDFTDKHFGRPQVLTRRHAHDRKRGTSNRQ